VLAEFQIYVVVVIAANFFALYDLFHAIVARATKQNAISKLFILESFVSSVVNVRSPLLVADRTPPSPKIDNVLAKRFPLGRIVDVVQIIDWQVFGCGSLRLRV